MPDARFFQRTGPYSLKKLTDVGQCRIADKASQDTLIYDVAPIDQAGEGHITFLNNPKYVTSLPNSKAKACILTEAQQAHAPENMLLLFSEDPYVSYARIAQLFYPPLLPKPGISKKAILGKKVKIGKKCHIAPGVVIGNGAQIGDYCVIEANSVIGNNVMIGNHCYIHPQVTITHTIIGNHTTIHTGVRIGQDGFGFATEHGQHLSVPQLGRVLIGNHVNIGANTCIDRGAGPDTIISDGCRVDNLVQIGHNVQLGKGCVIVSQVGISGSTKCGDYVVIGGQAGIAGHLQIGSMAKIAAQSGIMQDLAAKEAVGGSPALPLKQWHRQTIALKQLTMQRKKND